MPRKPKNKAHFVAANKNAKSDAVAIMVRAARRARLDYAGFLYVCQQVRLKLKLVRPKREHKLPHLLPGSALKRFFQIIQACGKDLSALLRSEDASLSISFPRK